MKDKANLNQPKFHHSNINRRRFLAGSAALGLSLSAGLPSFAAEEKKLNFWNWDTYIGEDTLPNFEQATGIKVNLDLFANNDEMFGKLQNGNPGYDLIVPSDSYVQRMATLGLLQPLNYDKIPNVSNQFKQFQEASFDPGRKYSVTYMWGTTGIGYNKRRVKTVPDSWAYLYTSDDYAGRISMLSEAREMIGAGLKLLGYSINETDPKRIKEVEEMIIAQKSRVKTFHTDNGQDLLISGEVDLVHEYSGDIVQVMEEDPNLSYIVPQEGASVWQDNLAIPVDAPHPENAHAFINFILDAKVGREIADYIRYATPNEAAYKLMDDDYRQDPAIYPSPEVLAKCETISFLGLEHDRLLDATITRIRAA